jgi:hypothetical protein
MRSASQQAGAPAQPFPFGPVWYRDDHGRRSGEPGPLLGAQPRYSLTRLAAYFTGPALYRDFRPECPWPGITLERPRPPEPGDGTAGAVGGFQSAFGAQVREALAGHDCVAVAFSGGMDSAAVLYAAWQTCRDQDRRLVAVTLGQRDDDGRRTDRVAAEVAAALGIGCELVTVDGPAERWPEPSWAPAGPRFDAEPRLHRAIAETAMRHGAQVLLHGLGADQLIKAPRFLAAELLLAGRPRAAAGFAADRRRDGGLPAELAALAARALRPPARAAAYLAFARRDLADSVSPVLTEAAAVHARRWLAGAVRRVRADHARSGRSWAAAEAIDALFPIDMLDQSTGLPERAPFLTPPVAASAWRIPLTDRYRHTLPSPYFRAKALVLSLLPDRVQQALVPHRQRGYHSYSAYWQAAGDTAPRLTALGLVRPDWRERCRSAFDAAMVHACERWVTGAEEHGAQPLEAGW